MSAPNTKHGKIFEAYVSGVMTPLMSKHRIHWKRIKDSASGGNLVEATEGDFELVCCSGERGRPVAFGVECKASINHTTLASGFRGLLKVKQQAKMRLRMRGGMFGVFLFFSVENQEIEVWSALPLIQAFPNKRERFFGQPYLVVAKENFPSVAERWVTSPTTFLEGLIKSETL